MVSYFGEYQQEKAWMHRKLLPNYKYMMDGKCYGNAK